MALKKTDQEGYTFTLFYNFGDQFVNSIKTQERWDDYYPLTYQPFVRFDRWVPDTDARDVRTDIWTIGFNYFFAQTTKLQVNYNITRDYRSDGGVYNNDAFLAQFQFGF
ncbi:porin [Geobacter sp. OR-1]|uniref:porin n=1 Tax=Geobacter sp. OR-1 TaxID=1266765 RepID=UPI0005A7B3D1|nr:porin [Geobacter sp. OR-1]